jgi:hypothetical protein
MRWQLATFAPVLGVLFLGAPAGAQDTGGAHHAMMGSGHDSVTVSEMRIFHELIVNHDRIQRTVTNLANGIRTVTESDDAAIAELIRQHVAGMQRRLSEGRDPGLPMESPALQTLFRDRDRISTTVETTAKGVVLVQTSSDPATVEALQQHASEVSELARGGMAAMHEAMMKNGAVHGGMMDGMMDGMMGGMHGTMMGGTHAAMHGDTMQADSPTAHATDHADHAGHSANPDSAFAALQLRGLQAMGVDQYTSTHHFDALADGGRIELQRDVDDAAGVAQIREHLKEIVRAFESGDFSTPAFVHMQQVPGTAVMAARRGMIRYIFRELPRGGEVRIITTDAAAVEAIHAFLAFQRQDHRAGGMEDGRIEP